MGQCQCCSDSNALAGEDFILNILEDQGFKLNTFSYSEILNELLSKRDNQLLPKKNLEEEFFEEILNEMQQEQNLIFFKQIINLILSKLEINNNMYKVVLLFYPFVNHEEENIEESFYSLFKYTCTVLTVKSFGELLTQYVTFITKELTQAILQKVVQTNIKQSLEDEINNIFTDRNIEKFVDTIILDIKKFNKKSSDKEPVTIEAIKEILIKYDLSSAKSIRNIFLIPQNL